MSIKKQYLKSKPVCKVTFTIPKSEAPEAEKVAVVGEFNDWSTNATTLKKRKDGVFTGTVELETGRPYQFRYLVNDSNWKNDSEADGYVPSPYGDGENCLLNI